MEREIPANRDGATVTPRAAVVGVVALSALFAVTVLSNSRPWAIDGLRAVAGGVFALVLPGALLARLLGVPSRPLGPFGLYAGAAGLATLTVLSVALSVLAPLVGVSDPLSVGPLSVAIGGLVCVLLLGVVATDTEFTSPTVPRIESVPFLAAMALLPVLAAVAADLVSTYGTDLGSFAFVAAVIVAVMLASTRYVPRRRYPALVFSLALAALFQRNLLSAHVVGADVQEVSWVVRRIARAHRWLPATGAPSMAIPVMSVGPAAFSVLTGVDVTYTFTVVYVALFALVPLGVFYVGRTVFDPEAGLYGALFFLFYHLTFWFTPGKQLVSELFVVALVLLVYRRDVRGRRRLLAFGVLSAGLVGSHYGTTYLFAVSAFFAAVVALVSDRFTGARTPRVPLWYPIALVSGASAWYEAVSPVLFGRLASVPGLLVGQASSLLRPGSMPGSGASYVGQHVGPLTRLTLSVYVLLIGLAALGIGRRALRSIDAIRRRVRASDPHYVALAIPPFCFLAASYVFVLNIWADRVYQMALVFVAPFAAVGYRGVVDLIRGVGSRLASGSTSRGSARPVQWSVLALVLAGLFAMNSGMAFALTGNAHNSTFDPNANDLVFNAAEVQGATWLETHVDPPRFARYRPPAASRPGAVRIYADPQSFQLLRSKLPPGFYDVQLIPLKNKWHRHVTPGRLKPGYVVIRRASVTDAARAKGSSTFVSRADARAITDRGTVVFRNDQIRIVRIGPPRNGGSE